MRTGPNQGDLSPDTDSPAAVGRPTGGFGRALYWSYVLSGGQITINLAVSLLLAGLLGPEAFGLLAMANVYILLVEMLIRQGMPAALIQRPDLDRRHLDTAFWMVLAVVGALVPTTILLSGWWAGLNGVPDLRAVIIGLSPVLLLRGLSVVQESVLRRRLEFRALALRTNLAVITGGLTGVALALAGFGVWALVGQQITLAAVEVVVLWTVSDWRPTRRFDSRRARDLLGFSGLSSMAGVGVFLQDKVDALLIGLMFGPVAVGLYRMAARLTSEVVTAVAGALQSVSLPELARFATEPDALNRRVRELVHLSSLLAAPALGLLAIVAEPLLALVGNEWVPAVTALYVLCVAAAVHVPAALTGPLLQAAGHPGHFAGVTWLSAGASALAFASAGVVLQDAPLPDQLLGLALSRALAMTVVVVGAVVPLLARVLGLDGRGLARAVLPSSLTSGGIAVGVVALRQASGWVDGWGPLVTLLASAAIGAVLLFGATLLVDTTARQLVRTGWQHLRQRVDGPPADDHLSHSHPIRGAEGGDVSRADQAKGDATSHARVEPSPRGPGA